MDAFCARPAQKSSPRASGPASLPPSRSSSSSGAEAGAEEDQAPHAAPSKALTEVQRTLVAQIVVLQVQLLERRVLVALCNLLEKAADGLRPEALCALEEGDLRTLQLLQVEA